MLHRISTPQTQRGATLIGTLVIMAILGLGLYGCIRLFPLYMEYLAVIRAMEQVAKSEEPDSTSPAELRRLLGNRWDIEDIKSLDTKEIEITKVDGGIDLHAAYRAEAPFIANVSLVVDFERTVEMR